MKNNITIVGFLSLLIASPFSFAANKVVVIPMGGASASGADGTIQYNNGGSIAGTTNLHYDDVTGFLGIGTSSPATDIEISQSSTNILGTGGITYSTTNTANTWKTLNSGTYYSFILNNARVAYVDNSGAWVQPSSRRFKTNINAISQVLGKTMQLRPVTYQYKRNPAGEEVYGFVAEEVATIFPELVKHDEEGNLGVSYAGFGPIAIRAIQEQQQQIDQLQKTNDALQARLSRIEQALNQ